MSSPVIRIAQLEVLVVTGDRDAFQLIDENVTVLYPVRGVSELARMDPAAVTAKYGLAPELYADFAALRGDKSDNLPGIRMPQPRVLQINGMYRHGFMQAPALHDVALQLLNQGQSGLASEFDLALQGPAFT